MVVAFRKNDTLHSENLTQPKAFKKQDGKEKLCNWKVKVMHEKYLKNKINIARGSGKVM